MFSPQRLKDLRRRQGLTCSDIHRHLLGIGIVRCRALVNSWEAGKATPGANEVQALALLLGVRLEDLFEPISEAPVAVATNPRPGAVEE